MPRTWVGLSRPTTDIVRQTYKCHTFLELQGEGLSPQHHMGLISVVILNSYTRIEEAKNTWYSDECDMK